jgi:hypothetical protein
MSYQSDILFEARYAGRFTWWQMALRLRHMKVTSIADACRSLARKGMLSVQKENRKADPIYEITPLGLNTSEPPPSFYRLTLKKVDPIYYEIISIETNIPERLGTVLATVWCGTAARACEFTPGMQLNKWQAAQQINDTSITVIGLEAEDEKFAADCFYSSHLYPNKYHRQFG